MTAAKFIIWKALKYEQLTKDEKSRKQGHVADSNNTACFGIRRSLGEGIITETSLKR